MSIRPLATALVLGAATLISAAPLSSQLPGRITSAAGRAAEQELQKKVTQLVRDAVRCSLGDAKCEQDAKKRGKDVVYIDPQGRIITDSAGVPITDGEKAAQQGGGAGASAARPGEGAWANYDFVPGDEILFYDDFTGDVVGDFPRRLDLVQGNFEVVEWQGGRYLRATSGGLFAIPLPRTLPDRFTVEYEVNLTHGNAYVRLTTGRAYFGPARTYRGSAPSVEMTRAGLRWIGGAGPLTLTNFDSHRVSDSVVAVRVMADGDYMKMYLDELRVANVPNAVFPRSDTLFVAVNSASAERPILIGPIRVAAGGRDLYDRLERDGRVATQGILFATGSDKLRPESTPTLKEIGTALKEHPDLRLSIEGHTDSDGEEAFNQTLSEKRAAAVKTYLVATFGVDGSRLETAGFGESHPVADNTTPEGKQQNRRVELVRR